MVEQLLKYYKNKVTAYGLVFRHMKVTYNLLIFFISITSTYLIISIPNIFWGIFQDNKSSYSFLISSVILILITSVLFKIFNRKAKDILEKKHKIIVKEKHWRNQSFNSLQNKNILDYIIVNNLNNTDKINQLISILTKEIERRKFPALLAPGIIVSFSLPIWIQLLNKLFYSVSSQMDALSLSISLVLILCVLVGFISLLKWIFTQLIGVMLISETTLMKHLIEKLEEIMLIEFVD